MAHRILHFGSRGGTILVKRPFLSYLYLLDNISGLAGFEWILLFQERGLYDRDSLTSFPRLINHFFTAASHARNICGNVGPHPEVLQGGKA